MSVQRTSKLFFTIMLIMLTAATAAFAAEASRDRAILTVGSEVFNDTEIINVLVGLGEVNEMMVALMLSQTTLQDRREFVGQIADAVLFAEAAKGVKLDQRTDVAFQIRWQTLQTLVQAYFEQVSAQWDFSEPAARKYYKEHSAQFFRKEAVRAAHILTETESEALTAALEATSSNFDDAAQKYSRDTSTAQNGGDLGWVEKGTMTAPVDEAIMNGAPGQLVGPVQSEYGWHIIKIEERRGAGQLTFEESKQAIFNSMQSTYVDQELRALRVKYPVTIDDEALGVIGGIPARESTE